MPKKPQQVAEIPSASTVWMPLAAASDARKCALIQILFLSGGLN